ncbi:MAG: glycosyltransferase [Desulfamplus sp.]|nr:glycosyltransferase [Desulfamplus sp.]
MNVGIVTTWFERGASYVSRQFEKTLSEKYNIFIYARGGEKYAIGDPNWDKNNVTWGERNFLSTPTYVNISDFRKWIINNSIDLIIFNEQLEWKPIIACNQLNVLTGAYIDYYKKDTVSLFGAYDFLICNTKRHHSVFKWHPQCFYVPWGTDTDVYLPKSINKNKNDKLFFFHSCGMNPKRKGTGLLLEAFKKVDRLNSKLIIHTQVDLQSFVPSNWNFINKCVNEGSLQIIKETVAAPGLYHLGDVYVYPSILDGIGLTILEAISCGLPSIVTNQQPMNEFIKNDDAGKLINVAYEQQRGDSYFWPESISNTNSIAFHMNYYIENRKNINDLKAKARNYALKHLDWNKNSIKLNEIIKNVKKIKSLEKDRALENARHYDNKLFIVNILNNSRMTIKIKKKLKKIIWNF